MVLACPETRQRTSFVGIFFEEASARMQPGAVEPSQNNDSGLTLEGLQRAFSSASQAKRAFCVFLLSLTTCWAWAAIHVEVSQLLKFVARRSTTLFQGSRLINKNLSSFNVESRNHQHWLVLGQYYVSTKATLSRQCLLRIAFADL